MGVFHGKLYSHMTDYTWVCFSYDKWTPLHNYHLILSDWIDPRKILFLMYFKTILNNKGKTIKKISNTIGERRKKLSCQLIFVVKDVFTLYKKWHTLTMFLIILSNFYVTVFIDFFNFMTSDALLNQHISTGTTYLNSTKSLCLDYNITILFK